MSEDQLAGPIVVLANEFRKAHKDRLLLVVLTFGVASVFTAFVTSLAFDVVPKSGVQWPLMFAFVLAGLTWVTVAFSLLRLKRHLPFYVDSNVFTPYLPPIRWVWMRRRQARYEEVASAEFLPGEQTGIWLIVLKMKTGEELWIPRVREIPDSAFTFVLEQLTRHRVPLRRISRE